MLSMTTLICCVAAFVICGLLAKEAIKWATHVDEHLAAQREIANHFRQWYVDVQAQLAKQRKQAVKDLIAGVHNLAAAPKLPGTPDEPTK